MQARGQKPPATAKTEAACCACEQMEFWTACFAGDGSDRGRANYLLKLLGLRG